jgi:hypothetical protein
MRSVRLLTGLIEFLWTVDRLWCGRLLYSAAVRHCPAAELRCDAVRLVRILPVLNPAAVLRALRGCRSYWPMRSVTWPAR